MDSEAVLVCLDRIEDAARDTLKAVENFRSTFTAPPDPNPQHRVNLLRWRFGEIENAAAELSTAVETLREHSADTRGRQPRNELEGAVMEGQGWRMRSDGTYFKGGN